MGPTVTVDLDVIERNARTVTAECASRGMNVFGVTKGTCGTPAVARAMLRGGVVGIGESRFENVVRLRQSGLDCQILLLRSPPLSRVDDAVTWADISLVSELAIIEALSDAAVRHGRVHDVILMVDLGDLREGVWPDDLLPTASRIVAMPGVRIVGIGTNLTCFGAVLPSERNMGELAAYAAEVEAELGVRLTYVSGGNSSSLPFLLDGRMPPGVNNLRVGETILQGGRDTFFERPWETLDRNAFLLSGELLEVKVKPSVPIGETGVDAFGGRPVFEDRGDRLRGILNLGREDVVVDALIPVEDGVEVLGASSDHLIVDLTDVDPPPRVGSALRFRMGYGALLAAMTSEYVEKRLMYDQPPQRPSRVTLTVDDAHRAAATTYQLADEIRAVGFEVLEASNDEPSSDTGAGSVPVPGLVSGPVSVPVSVSVSVAADRRGTADLLAHACAGLDAVGLVWVDAGAAVVDPAGPVRLPAAVSPENVVLVGLRHATPQEAEAIRGTPVTALTIVDVDRLGMREVARRALQVATNGTRGYLVCYGAAATDLPAWVDGLNGISARETHQLMEAFAAAPGLLAIDAVVPAEAGVPVVEQVLDFALSALGRTIV